MFENTTPQTPPQNPLNPVMPAPGMINAQAPTPTPPQPLTSTPPSVHSMPERFRNTGPAAGGPSGSSKTKKLVITLIIVVVVAGLGVAGLFIFNKVVKSNTNTTNGANTTNIVTNVANLNTAINTNTATNENVNVANTNTAINVNSLANDNTNTVTNTTSNTNTTTNANSNTNSSTNTNTAVSVTPLPSNTDTDSDGLTDTEELVFTTDASKADTDGDGFIDGRKIDATTGAVSGEVALLYNPKGAGKLEDSTLVKRVQNATKTFGLLVPATWTTNESSGLLVVTPATTTGEFFQIRIYDNATNLTAQQWYQTNYPQGQVNSTTSIAVNGLEGIVSPDGTSVYLFKNSQVYGLTYTTGSLSQVNFWTTFEVMKNSFKLVAAS